MTASEILEKRFDRAAVGGYRMENVNAFMQTVANTVESLEAQKTELESKLIVLADRLEEYRTDEESMRAALLGAQKLGDTIIKDSKDKSEHILEDAVKEAESVITKAQSESDRVFNDARIQLETESYALNKMKREVARFKKQLMALYKQHITLIEALPAEDNLPVVEKPRAEAPAPTESAPPPLSSPLVSNIQKRVQAEKESINDRVDQARPQTEAVSESEEKSDGTLFPQRKPEGFKPIDFGEGFRKFDSDNK